MSLFLDRPGPRWFNIPAHRPFAQDLARGLVEALAPAGPDALSQAIVLTPTRRGARALADAFVAAAGGRAVLPPQMRPLGDLEEGEPPFEPGDLALDLPAAIDPLKRRFELTRLVADHAHLLSLRDLTASTALELAEALGGFFDSVAIEEAEVEGKLADLVESDLAEHWQVSRSFLEAAVTAWRMRLDDLGVVDVSERRVRLLRRLAAAWRARPPEGVLVAAGSTGTAPATRDLLVAVAEAPRGCVVLPGLDESLADSAWAKVDVQHPQGALKRLLEAGGVDKRDVRPWPASITTSEGRARQRVINEALRPAEETADWLGVIRSLGEETIAQGLNGLSLVSAASEEQAATVAALLLREALETPDRTAALVSPDQALARRVVAKLARWGVVPDSSAGESLAGCRCGSLARLVARAAADPLNSVTLLALLKHPFTRFGRDSEALAGARRVLEKRALRGARPRSFEAVQEKLDAHTDARQLATDLAQLLNDLRAVFAEGLAPPADAARAVTVAMERLAADAAGGLGELWSGHGGEAMSRLLSGLIHDAHGLPGATARGFADLLERLMAGETVRAGGATHPRLRILGAIEARLVRADRLVVAGLEEGVWPRGAPLDPFLSRPMRERLGLPSPERRVGLAAHDFAQAACAPDVVLLHTERREGAPTVKSRWLWRLETLARGARLGIATHPEALAWARALDAPGAPQPYARPSPRPPVEARPSKLFVTRVEALTRDPYAVWARDILGLRELSRPDEPVDVRVRGTAIHEAFEKLAIDWPGDPERAAADFETYYLDGLRSRGMPEEALAREGALAREAAAWVAKLELERRADGRAIHVEKTGELTLMVDGEPFTVAAKADRIEITPDGFGHVLDFKTGSAPSLKMVRSGFSPQLTLTAAILARAGFDGLPAAPTGELTYLQVTGRNPPGREEVRACPGGDGKKQLDSEAAAETALEGLAELVRRYRDPARGYTSRLAPQFVKLHASEYDHLARVFEWSTSGAEGDE